MADPYSPESIEAMVKMSRVTARMAADLAIPQTVALRLYLHMLRAMNADTDNPDEFATTLAALATRLTH